MLVILPQMTTCTVKVKKKSCAYVLNLLTVDFELVVRSDGGLGDHLEGHGHEQSGLSLLLVLVVAPERVLVLKSLLLVESVASLELVVVGLEEAVLVVAELEEVESANHLPLFKF